MYEGGREGGSGGARLRPLVARHDLGLVALLARGLADVRRTGRDPGQERLVEGSPLHAPDGFLADDVVAESAGMPDQLTVLPEARPLPPTAA